jgi:hypothetical protein
MSPTALELLTKAYKHYLETYDHHFSYLFKNENDLYYSRNGAQQLEKEGYIDNVSDNVHSSRISIFPLDPITFDLTNKGIDFMQSQRKL